MRIDAKNTEKELEDLKDLLFRHPELTDQISTIKVSLNLYKFNDLNKCNKAEVKLNKFFEVDEVINVVMFQYEKPNSENVIKGTFVATLPLSEKHFNLFLDLLVLNLISANTIAFDNTIIIQTDKEKYLIKQSITIDH